MCDAPNEPSNETGSTSQIIDSSQISQSSGSNEAKCSDQNAGTKRSHANENKDQLEESSDSAKKRPRGPYDCLNWDEDSEDEFVPFTQSNPEVVHTPVKKVFAKKSSAKSCSKSSGKSSAKTSAKSSAKTLVNSAAKNSGSKKSKEKGKSGICLICL